MAGSYMMTVFTLGLGHQDVRVDDAEGILAAIEAAEKATGARVSHGREGVGAFFDPAILVNAASGAVEHLHDGLATVSTQIVTSPRAAEVREALLLEQGVIAKAGNGTMPSS